MVRRPFRLAAALAAVIISSFSLTGCLMTQPPQGDPLKVGEARSRCNQLYNETALDPLRDKVRLRSDASAPPTRPMLQDASFPSPAEREAVRHWEEVERSCAGLLAGAGRRSAASEDIVAKRMSDLRWRLAAGEISFAVFNGSYVDVLMGHYDRQALASQAWERGTELGATRAAEFNASMHQIRTEMELHSLRGQIHELNRSPLNNPLKTWQCDGSRLGTGYTVYTCR